MRPLRALFVAVTVIAGSALVVGITAGPAGAHEHPTPVELVSPAAVRVETYAQVSISLIEHNKTGAHIGLLQRTYTPLLASGSGFAVDPTGGIVTSQKLIDVDLKRSEIFAVNKIFNERYGGAAPLPADPFAPQTLTDVDPSAQMAGRLQRCYQPNTTDDTGGCVIFTTRMVKVLPFVSSQKQFGDLPATVLVPAPGQSGDIAVLKVGASSMPTVDLATSTQGVAAFSLLGFSEPPSGGRSLQKIDGHFVEAGSATVKKDADQPKVAAAMTAGLAGGPIVGERGQVVGFLVQRGTAPPGDAASDLTLIGPEAVRAALSAAGIEPHRGPTDAVYEDAMHNYKNKLYTPAIPSLEQTLKLYPGHALAAEALADADQKKGTADDLTGRDAPGLTTQSEPGMNLTRLVLAGGAVLAPILLIIALLLRRRIRRVASPAGQAGTGPSPPPPAAAPAAAPAPGPVPAPAPVSVPHQRMPDQSAAEPMRESMTVRLSQDVLNHAPAGAGSGPAADPVSRWDSTQALAPDDVAPVQPDWHSACPHCGQQVFRSQPFCGNCGQRLQ